MLVVIGISHKTAGINIREQLAFSPEKISTALNSLVCQAELKEAALLSTCNRTEIYGAVETSGFDPKQLVRWWRSFKPESANILIEPVYYQLSNEKVVSHLMRLACGLDSLALGETQILGQLKQVYQQSKQLGLLSNTLGQTFEASFNVAKKVRTQTEITKHPISIAYLGMTLAKQIFTDISKIKILLIGAGENTRQMIVHLKAHQVTQATIVNRTYEKALLLAEQYHLSAAPYANLTEEIAKADMIISSTYSEIPLIDKALMTQALKRQKHRPILMLDLGVPRDIHPDVCTHEDVYLYTIDDLQAIADENRQSRENAAVDAERIISYEASAFVAKLHAKNHIQSIKSMREKADFLKNKAVSVAQNKLKNGLTPQEVIEQLAYSLTNQLIHEPTVRMKEALTSQDELMLSIYKEMFGIK